MITKSTSLAIFSIFALILKCSGVSVQSDRVVFSVDEVEPAAELMETVPALQAVQKSFPSMHTWSGIESTFFVQYSEYDLPRMGNHFLTRGKDFKFNNFATTIHLAHSQHRSLQISPDMIWLLILHGFAIHKQKETSGMTASRVIKVEGPELGTDRQQWSEAIESLSDELLKQTEMQKYRQLLPEFSTTGSTERFVMRATLMSAFKNTFSYEYGAICGIPEIELLGTVEDWELIIERTKLLEKEGLKWWTDRLIPILTEFRNARSGNVNKEFWQSIYKKKGEYVARGLNGWILQFYPYLNNPQTVSWYNPETEKMVIETSNERFTKNRFVVEEKPCEGEECFIGLEQMPTDIFAFDLTYIQQTTGRKYHMKVSSGFLGISQIAEKNMLRPYIGWVVESK